MIPKNRKVKLIIVFITLTAGCHAYRNYLFSDTVIGTYVNRNIPDAKSFPEGPYEVDTLHLYKNGRYSSKFWGKGSYEITHGLKGTELSIADSYGSGFHTFMWRSFTGTPKILIYEDLNYYYEKIP